MRRTLAFTAAFVTALATTGAASPRSTDIDACSLLSTTRIGAVLGQRNVEIRKNVAGKSSADNVFGVTHSICFGVAWSGAEPTTAAESRLAAANGRAAAFAIDTWAPDESSRYVARWKAEGFDRLTNGFTAAAILFGGLPGAPSYRLHRLLPLGAKAGVDGAIGATATPAPGIRSAAGAWWAYPSYALVSIAIVGAANDPSVAQLNELAKVAVTTFGLAPLRLR
jgi:hypothetical protein